MDCLLRYKRRHKGFSKINNQGRGQPLLHLIKREMKKIDWNKVAVVAFLQTMVILGMVAMIAVFELVEILTCYSC